MTTNNHTLRGAAKEVFSVIQRASGRVQLSGYYIAMITTYHPRTVYRNLNKLESLGLIERSRESAGHTYVYNVCRKQSGAE